MGQDAAIAMLRDHAAEVRRLGVLHLYLFGSVAAGKETLPSDVDLIF